MNATSMNLRLDKTTRHQLQVLADEFGIPATSLVVASIKQLLRSGELRLSSSLEPTEHLQQIMHQADRDIAAQKNVSKVYDSAEDFLADLDRE